MTEKDKLLELLSQRFISECEYEFVVDNLHLNNTEDVFHYIIGFGEKIGNEIQMEKRCIHRLDRNTFKVEYKFIQNETNTTI
jgi:hypothetical protein